MTRLLCTTVVLAISVVGAHAQDLAARMDAYLQASAKVKGFMGTALVAKGGTVILDKGYGFASIELNVPNAPANKFRLGSITKQFTAAAIMQLQEQGKLSVQDQACKYLDDCPGAWKSITIHHLLTHTSGIPSYTGLPTFATPRFMRIPLTPLEVLMLTRDKPLEFQPGEKWVYDNSGYIFLGHIIEKVSGRRYADYLKEHIFDPLDMKDSGYDDTRAILIGRASGYDRSDKGYRNADYLDMSLPYAAGSLYSTVDDLYRWDRALYTEKVVRKSSYAAMTTPVKNDYGYGLTVASVSGHQHVGHGGGINGFSTCIDRFPGDDAVVIVLSNVVQANSCRMGSDLASMLFGGKVDLPQEYKEAAIDPKILDRYTGKYSDGKMDFTVTANEGKLYFQPSGQPKFRVLPYSDHQFFLSMPDLTLDFSPADGRAEQVLVQGGGPKIVAKRVN